MNKYKSILLVIVLLLTIVIGCFKSLTSDEPTNIKYNDQVYKIIKVDDCSLAGKRKTNVAVDIGYGDREYYALTNEFGQVTDVFADELIIQDDEIENVIDGRYCNDEAKVPGTEKENLDEGHIIADSLGGASNAYNITPQNSTLNRNEEQAEMEKSIRNSLSNNLSVSDYHAVIKYDDNETMIPSHYYYEYYVEGIPIKYVWTFDNE